MEEFLPPETKIQLKENNPPRLQLLGALFGTLAGNNRPSGSNMAARSEISNRLSQANPGLQVSSDTVSPTRTSPGVRTVA
jgi:hypothetical protein